MSRPERLHVAGGRYFVIDEFRAPEVLVPAPDRIHTDAEVRELAAHRAQYEAQLAYALTRWCARVHTHCWLPQRALLEIQIAWAPLDHVMHSLRGPFSRYFRKATHSTASVYAGRYKAWLVEPGCTLDLRRAICWHAVRAGLCKHPTEYPHTTIHYALTATPLPFLAKSHLLAWLQQRQHHPRAQLLSFLTATPSPEFAALLSGSPHDRRIIGQPNFVRRMHQFHRTLRVPPPPAVIDWARVFIERVAATSSKPLAEAGPALRPALTAWLASCSGTASVSTAATWFPHRDRSQLERAVDHYMQVRPDLFSERALRQFVHDLFLPSTKTTTITATTGAAAPHEC